MKRLRLLTAALTFCACSFTASAQSAAVYTLEQIFESAEANGIQLKPFFTAEQEADKEISVARSQRLPDIDASLNVSYIGDGFTTKRNFSDRQKAPIPHLGDGFGISVTQPVFTGGAINAGIELARRKAAAARESTELQRDNIRFRLTEYYLDIYKYGNLRTVVLQNRLQAEKVLQLMHARYEQGVALNNDITRYELLVADLNLQLIKIDNLLSILNDNLVTIARLPEGTVVAPDSTILQKPLPRQDADWWSDEAIAHAPSLHLASSAVDISKSTEKLAKSELYPKIGLQARWTTDGPILVEVPPINRNLSYWFVGVGIDYSLSSLFKTNRKLAKSHSATVRAEAELDARREDLLLDVKREHIKYLEAYAELDTQEKSVELAEKNYKTVLTRYSADMALITDLLDAANSRLDAQQRLVNARINIIYYYYRLLYTTGKI